MDHSDGSMFVAVFEDDFQWKTQDMTHIDTIINHFLNHKGSDWDVLLLTGCIYGLITEHVSGLKDIMRCRSSQTATAYLVNRTYLPKMVEIFRQSADALQKPDGKYSEFALDKHWQTFQKTDRWYITIPGLGKQRPGFSNIENEDVSYQFI